MVSKTSNYKESLLWFKIRRSPIKYNANGLKTNLLWPHRYTYIGIVHTEIGVAKSIINNTINWKVLTGWIYRRCPRIFYTGCELFSLLHALWRPLKGLSHENSRAIVAHHKILILLKGHFAIYKRKSSVWMALQFQIVMTILPTCSRFLWFV